MEFVRAFIVGGLICVVGQLLIDLTKLTPARIMVIFVVAGVILGALGIYPLLVEWGGAGASIPIIGFEMFLQKVLLRTSTKRSAWCVQWRGEIRSSWDSAAVFFGYIMAVVSKPKTKNKT